MDTGNVGHLEKAQLGLNTYIYSYIQVLISRDLPVITVVWMAEEQEGNDAPFHPSVSTQGCVVPVECEAWAIIKSVVITVQNVSPLPAASPSSQFTPYPFLFAPPRLWFPSPTHDRGAIFPCRLKQPPAFCCLSPGMRTALFIAALLYTQRPKLSATKHSLNQPQSQWIFL